VAPGRACEASPRGAGLSWPASGGPGGDLWRQINIVKGKKKSTVDFFKSGLGDRTIDHTFYYDGGQVWE